MDPHYDYDIANPVPPPPPPRDAVSRWFGLLILDLVITAANGVVLGVGYANTLVLLVATCGMILGGFACYTAGRALYRWGTAFGAYAIVRAVWESEHEEARPDA